MSYDKFSLLLPMNGANNGTVFTDYSPVQKVVTATGAVTSTAQFKYYDSSGFFDGTDDFLSIPNSAAFQFGTGDFTIGAWARPTSFANNPNIFSQRSGVSGAGVTMRFNTGGQLQVFNGEGSNLLTSSVAASVNAWTHVEWCRVSGQYYLFVGGVAAGTASVSADVGGTANANIGRSLLGAEYFPGHIQDLIVIKGVGLHTSGFTPPTRLIGTIDNSAVGASKILDINGDPAERTVFAVPRVAPTRVWSDVSNASGEFSIQAPAGVDHSVVALADETGLRNDIVHRVVPV